MPGLKIKVDNLDVDKLKTVPAILSKLSTILDNDVVKKTVHDKLVIKVNAFDTKIKKHSMNQTNRDLKWRFEMLPKRYPILVRWPRRLIATQKLQILKTRYLVLLVY